MPPHTARRTIAGALDDVFLLVVAVFMFPIVILLVGLPIALVVRGILEIVHRLS